MAKSKSVPVKGKPVRLKQKICMNCGVWVADTLPTVTDQRLRMEYMRGKCKADPIEVTKYGDDWCGRWKATR